MTERWRGALRRLEDASPTPGLLDRARMGSTSGVPDRRGTSRVLAGIVALALFAGSGVLVWSALGPRSELRDAGPQDDEPVTYPSPPADVLTMREDDDDLFTATYPNGWFVPADPINDWVCSPYEILALATYPLRPGGEAVTDFQLPSRAVQDLGANDILIWVNENGSACGGPRDSAGPSGFPDRPARFGPVRVCGDFDLLCPSDGQNLVPGIRSWWIAFSDSGRSFYVFVGMGEDAYADPERQQQAWDVLDSLQFLPR